MKKTSQPPVQRENPGLAFAQAFLRGDIAPFDGPIENSQAFVDLVDKWSERGATIESAVMELAHGSCHALTLALATKLDLETIAVIRGAGGMPVHSAIHDPAESLILDANGVHRIEDALAFWESLAGGRCTISYEEPEMLAAFYDCDEDEQNIALEDFNVIAEFATQEIICSHAFTQADAPHQNDTPHP